MSTAGGPSEAALPYSLQMQAAAGTERIREQVDAGGQYGRIITADGQHGLNRWANDHQLIVIPVESRGLLDVQKPAAWKHLLVY